MIHVTADLLGADRPQEELLPGALSALSKHEDLVLHLVLDAERAEAFLRECSWDRERLSLVHAPCFVSGNTDPMKAVREIPDSSMMQGLRLSKTFGEDGAFVTCGPTGILYVASMVLLGKAVPVTPCLLASIYKKNGDVLAITDCGAVLECDAGKLTDFTRMGLSYLRASGVENPKAALLSLGSEDTKGTPAVREANRLLRESGLPFLGNIEGQDVLRSGADLIVCEGFYGNVLLKTIEGSAKPAMDELRDAFLQDGLGDPGRILELSDRVRWKYNYNDNGGAVLLGLKQPVVKGHGAAGPETLESIITIAYRLAANRLTETITGMFRNP